MTADITVHGPGEVLATLPYQLGYHPSESVVLVAFAGRRVGLVARCDIPPPAAVPDSVAALVAPVLREGFGAAIVVGYESREDDSGPLLVALVEALEAERVRILHVVVVRDGRFYSPACPEWCCPTEGSPVPEAADVAAVAELVVRGRAPLRSRDDVHGLVEPHGDPAVVARLLGRRLRSRGDAAARAWAEVLAPPVPGSERLHPGRLPPRVVADAAAGLADIAWRDGLIGWVAPGVLPRDVLRPAVVARLERSLPRWAGMGGWERIPGPGPARSLLLERLLALCRAVPDECPTAAAGVCTVAAHVAWADGEGAVTRVALERALRLEPTYRLAILLAGLVDHGLPLAARPPEGDGELGRAG
jgi:hypothetical protein